MKKQIMLNPEKQNPESNTKQYTSGVGLFQNKEPPELNVFFCLHCETDWNEIKQLQGRQDNPLNEKGRKQAKNLALLITQLKLGIKSIYSSPLKRAFETAQIISKQLALLTPVKKVDNLIAVDAGEAMGLSKQELSTRFGEDFMRRWNGDDVEDDQLCFPKGETKWSVRTRALEVLDFIKENRISDALFISHGFFC